MMNVEIEDSSNDDILCNIPFVLRCLCLSCFYQYKPLVIDSLFILIVRDVQRDKRSYRRGKCGLMIARSLSVSAELESLKYTKLSPELH